MASRGRRPPNVNLGHPGISETTTARKLNLKISLGTKIIMLYDTTRGRHIDFRQMSISEADYG